MSYRSKVFYTGTGSEQVLSVTFPYLDITHVHVHFDGVLQEDNIWSWVTSSTIAITATNAAEIEIFRSTPYDPMVTFTNASLLNEDDQNMAALQAIYLIEELLDGQTILEAIVEGFNLTNNTFAVTFVIDGGGLELATGQHGHIMIPFPCAITEAHAYADRTGSVVIDIWQDHCDNFPPTDEDSITAAAPVTISNGVKVVDTALTGWDTAIPAGGVLAYNVDSVSTVRRVTVTLVVQK